MENVIVGLTAIHLFPLKTLCLYVFCLWDVFFCLCNIWLAHQRPNFHKAAFIKKKKSLVAYCSKGSIDPFKLNQMLVILHNRLLNV